MQVVNWFSAGITSAVAGKMAINKYGSENVANVYFEIASAHPDNDRFIADCEKWYGQEIHRRRGKYDDQFDVIGQTRYLNGPSGARCTTELKRFVRVSAVEEFNPDIQVYGFHYSKPEINRAVRAQQQIPDTTLYFPLIEAEMTKDIAAQLLLDNGIGLPAMYLLGFANNNCIGCVKGGKGYWNLIRKTFPEVFDRMARLEREIGRTCVSNPHVFLDELDPERGNSPKQVAPSCDSSCELEYVDLIDPLTDQIMEGTLQIKDVPYDPWAAVS